MWALGVVFFCVPITLFWLLVFVKYHHLEVSCHLFDISGEEHMAIQRQNPVWHHKPQGKVGIVKTPGWGLWTLPDCLHSSAAVLSKQWSSKGLCSWLCAWAFFRAVCWQSRFCSKYQKCFVKTACSAQYKLNPNQQWDVKKRNVVHEEKIVLLKQDAKCSSFNYSLEVNP